MKRSLVFSILVVIVVAAILSAQGPARFPVIVVLEDNVRFSDFARQFHPDAREAADPPAWGYLDRGVFGAVQSLERRLGFQSDHVYSHSVRGFAASLTAEQVQQLERDSMVKRVEPDGTMFAVGKDVAGAGQTVPWGIAKIGADKPGLQEVAGVNVFVIDTGIDRTHRDLNVVQHVNFAGGRNAGCDGHGTHVAGTIAARDNTVDVVGVAPGAPLTDVKVLGCGGSGSVAGVIKGVDWVTANHGALPAVANMSLGGSAYQALDDAVVASVASGVFYALAAGNGTTDACTTSPARAGAGTDNGIMTTGALDSSDQDPSWSNFGSCLDIWAPGVNILSTKKGGGTTTMSGTSMASPHVAGTAALYRAQNPSASPDAVESRLRRDGTATGTKANDGHAITRVDASKY